MRPKKNCPKFYPWTTTSRGERNEVCVDRERLEIKDCDCCIDMKTNEQKTSTNENEKHS